MGLRLDRALNRLLDQFSRGPNIRHLITAIIEQIEDTDAVLQDLSIHRWLTTAEGIWLDNIGAIVGLPRPFEFWPEDNLFGFRDDPLGLSDPDQCFGDNLGNGGWFMSHEGSFTSEPIDDDKYRHWLGVKIFATYSPGTITDVWLSLELALGSALHEVTDEAGKILITLNSAITQNEKIELIKFLPKIAGVRAIFQD